VRLLRRGDGLCAFGGILLGGLLWGDLFPKTYNGRASDLGDEGIPKGATTRGGGLGPTVRGYYQGPWNCW
jgi:hypothetical protein